MVAEGSSPLDVKQLENTGFSIYPNPANELLNIRFRNKNTGIRSAQIFDLSGRVIDAEIINESVDISSPSTGAYILTLKDAAVNQFLQKFLKK